MSEEIFMECGHEVATYKLEKQSGVVFIQYTCDIGCLTEWASVGEAPMADELDMDLIVDE